MWSYVGVLLFVGLSFPFSPQAHEDFAHIYSSALYKYSLIFFQAYLLSFITGP